MSSSDQPPILISSYRSRNRLLKNTVAILLSIAVLLSPMVPTTPAHAEEGIHVVVRGESLGHIARRYNISVRELIAQNSIINPNIIKVGQRLTIPNLERAVAPSPVAAVERPAQTANIMIAPKALPAGNGYYAVRRGDTLSQIAKGNGLSLNDMMRLNDIPNANLIRVGQQLRLSARVAPIDVDEAEPKLADLVYMVKQGETLEEIAQENNMTLKTLLRVNGLPHENLTWAGQRLRIQTGPKPAVGSIAANNAPRDGRRWIEVNLSTQTLTAWQGDVAVMNTYISGGLPATPTVTGRFRIGTKLTSQRMRGPGYDLPGVPWVMYFYGAYAIHGAYWHNNFGTPMSHGCVNMRSGDAQMLYNWAPAGTEVYVHY